MYRATEVSTGNKYIVLALEKVYSHFWWRAIYDQPLYRSHLEKELSFLINHTSTPRYNDSDLVLVLQTPVKCPALPHILEIRST